MWFLSIIIMCGAIILLIFWIHELYEAAADFIAWPMWAAVPRIILCVALILLWALVGYLHLRHILEV